MKPMRVLKVVRAGVAHPFGDSRTVQQAFPSGLTAEEADPFLMCDHFSSVSKGKAKEDDYPVDWHPHKGFDIITYLKSGIGRHADSMGNRCTFATPGMQWVSCGSGIEHAEGGGTPEGEQGEGFQIWVNAPAAKKLDDPRYGTVPPDQIPVEELGAGARMRLLAGPAPLGDRQGPFDSATPVSMIDFELEPGAALAHALPAGLDSAMLYVYRGGATLGTGEHKMAAEHIAMFDAASDERRGIELVASASEGMSALLFAGRRLKEPIAWHGPIVMNTQEEIYETVKQIRRGTFPPKRVDWDYKLAAAAPGA